MILRAAVVSVQGRAPCPSTNNVRPIFKAVMTKDASLHSQVIIAPQSPMLIDSFEPGDITVIDQDRNTNSTVAHRLDAEQLKLWLEDYTVSELWVKNFIGGLPL